MTCPECDGSLVAFRVPDDLREYAPGEEAALALCSRCLRLHPTDPESAPDAPSFDRVSEAFPAGDTGVAMALVVGLLDSIAHHRPALAALCDRVERDGADPFLCIDRLARQGSVQAHVDLDRRRHQLEQLV